MCGVRNKTEADIALSETAEELERQKREKET